MLAEAAPISNREYLTDTQWWPSRSSDRSETPQLAARIERRSNWRPRGLSSSLQQWNNLTWYEPTLQAAASLMQLPANWDRFGAPRIDPSMVNAVISLLTSVMRDDTPAPAVVPTTKGGIQLEWHTRGIDLEVEFLSPVRIRGLFEDQRDDDTWETDLSVNLKPLTEAISKLSRA